MKIIVIILMSFTLAFASGINFKPNPNSIFHNQNLQKYTSINEAIASDDVKDGDVLYIKEGNHFENEINITKNVTLIAYNNTTIIANINIMTSAICVFDNMNFGLEPEGELSSFINVESGSLTLSGKIVLSGKIESHGEIIVLDDTDFSIND